MMTPIRIALLADLPRLTGIYNQAIAAGNATADTVPFSVEERRGWFDAHLPHEHPVYVFEGEGQVLGWLSVSPYRGRSALARTGEVSYYVDYAHQGRGIGSALMAHALADASRIHKAVLLAILLESNAASIHLLEKFAFQRWAHLPNVAELGGRLVGQVYYGRILSES